MHVRIDDGKEKTEGENFWLPQQTETNAIQPYQHRQSKENRK